MEVTTNKAKTTSHVEGLLLADKPAGVTSHDVILAARRAYNERSIGHLGTLDPFATGLLLVVAGRATRLATYLSGLDKGYDAVVQFGAVSTTLDPEGEIAPGQMPEQPFTLPTGRITQRPPIYSAIKIDGKRAYARARAGEVVEVPEREVDITRFEQLSGNDEFASFAIECSSGTYVRTLIADLHDAYCVQLRRTHIGGFDVANADEERLIGLDDALSFLPVLDLEGDAAAKAAHGVAVPGHAKSLIRLRDEDGLIAIAEPRGGATLKPVVGFRG